MCVVSVAEYAETEKMRIGLRRYDKIETKRWISCGAAKTTPLSPVSAVSKMQALIQRLLSTTR